MLYTHTNTHTHTHTHTHTAAAAIHVFFLEDWDVLRDAPLLVLRNALCDPHYVADLLPDIVI